MKQNVKAFLGATALGSVSLIDPSIAAAQTFLGDSSTVNVGRHGPTTAQVKITVDAGKITAIQTVTLSGTPGWPASCINPTITNRALSAQSASVQGVSCASYSSAAWKNSLASAISKAGTALTGGATSVAPAPTTTTPKPSTTTAPTTPVVPKTVPTIAPRSGDDDNDHEGGEEGDHHGFGHVEGDDDGYRVPRPPRPGHNGVIAPAPVITPKATATPKTTVVPKATVTPKPSTTDSVGLTPKAGVIQKTITCVKGKLTKTVKSTNPKCPTGYTLKK